MAKKSSKKLSSKELDEKFDAGEDVLEHFDLKNPERPNQSKRINLDLPQWMMTSLDIEATRLGIPRQAVIKMMIDQALKKQA